MPSRARLDETLQKAFRVEDEDHADYLEDVTRWVKNDVNFYECGVQLTRSFKALKLWLSMRTRLDLQNSGAAIDIGFRNGGPCGTDTACRGNVGDRDAVADGGGDVSVEALTDRSPLRRSMRSRRQRWI